MTDFYNDKSFYLILYLTIVLVLVIAIIFYSSMSCQNFEQESFKITTKLIPLEGKHDLCESSRYGPYCKNGEKDCRHKVSISKIPDSTTNVYRCTNPNHSWQKLRACPAGSTLNADKNGCEQKVNEPDPPVESYVPPETCTTGWTDLTPASKRRTFACSDKEAGKYKATPEGYCPGNLLNVDGTCQSPDPPTNCKGSGWTDSKTKMHFDCTTATSGKYKPINGKCPPGLVDVDGVCQTKYNPEMPKDVPLLCSGIGWTDSNPASDGRHFDCTGSDTGKYKPKNNFCPGDLTKVNDTCQEKNVPDKCNGDGWIDYKTGINYKCAPTSGPDKNKFKATNGVCPTGLVDVDGICQPKYVPDMPKEVPKLCQGNGWTDSNPASDGRHFDCSGPTTGKYKVKNGFCPGNLINVNGVCQEKEIPAICTGDGWTDSKTKINYNCITDSGPNFGKYRPVNGSCPVNLTNVDGICQQQYVPPMPNSPPAMCSNIGWTDPNPASNGRKFDCSGPNTGKYKAKNGFCPGNLVNVNGICQEKIFLKFAKVMVGLILKQVYNMDVQILLKVNINQLKIHALQI